MAKPWEKYQEEPTEKLNPWEKDWDVGEKIPKWSEIPMQSAMHAIPSAINVIKSTYVDPLLHPIDTAQAALDLGNAAIQKALPQPVIDVMYKLNPETAKNPEKLNAAIQYFHDRYGSERGWKKALAEDPFGVAADLASAIQPTRLLAKGRVPAGVENLLNRASELDPTSTALKVAEKISELNIPSSIIGTITGTGSDVMRELYKSGQVGGEKLKTAYENMREPEGRFQEVATEAKNAVSNLARARSAQYEADMAGVRGNVTPINYDPIRTDIQDIFNKYNFRGEHSGELSQAMQNKLQHEIDYWGDKDPDPFHTPSGIDFLKRRVGEIGENAEFGTTPKAIADDAYQAVRQQIVNQEPEYANAMKRYADSSDLLHELTGTFSLGPKARTDTSIRKLQQALRNNAYTNYGYRSQLIDELEDAGARNLRTKVAGQAASSWMPRGLQGLNSAGAIGGAITYANPYALLPLPFQSPRLMGEAAIKAGQASNYVKGGLDAYKAALDKAGIDQLYANNYMYQLQKAQDEIENAEEE
jgi:hypothetical protein